MDIVKMQARAGGLELDIDIVGPIAYSEADGGVTAATVRDALKAVASARRINVYLNSGGGSAWTGLGIYNMLRGAGKPVRVVVEGLAASAAAVVAMAGDKIEMKSESFLMIHEGRTLSYGKADDMRRSQEDLERLNGSMANIFAQRSGKPLATVRDWMRSETWFTAQEAVDAGLADIVVAERALIAASCGFQSYKNTPAALRAALAAQWDEACHAERRRGVDMATACTAANKKHPGLREALVAAYNAPSAVRERVQPAGLTARADWDTKVDALIEKGMNPLNACSKVNRENPGLRERMVAEANGR